MMNNFVSNIKNIVSFKKKNIYQIKFMNKNIKSYANRKFCRKENRLLALKSIFTLKIESFQKQSIPYY